MISDATSWMRKIVGIQEEEAVNEEPAGARAKKAIEAAADGIAGLMTLVPWEIRDDVGILGGRLRSLSAALDARPADENGLGDVLSYHVPQALDVLRSIADAGTEGVPEAILEKTAAALRSVSAIVREKTRAIAAGRLCDVETKTDVLDALVKTFGRGNRNVENPEEGMSEP